jgi:outer membrane protein OmpA-like peptidoglycan-associated protein
VSKANYFNNSAMITTVGHEKGKDFVQDFILQPIPDEPILLPEILYDLAKWDLKPQYEDSLQGLIRTLDDNPRIVVELAAHTDARDTYERNDILSQRRAQSVVDYLILRGIDPDRLAAKGYGERAPRRINKDITREGYTFKKGDVLTEEYIAALPSEEIREAAHQMNRRTEFSVLRKDYIPKTVISEDPGAVVVQVNPEENVVTFRTQDKTGLYIIPLILNGYKDEFIYEDRAPAQVSLEKALQLLNVGIISKENFEGNPEQILADNSIRNNSIFVIGELRIGAKTIRDVPFTVVHRQQNAITLGRQILQRIGDYSIDEAKREITFEYKDN